MPGGRISFTLEINMNQRTTWENIKQNAEHNKTQCRLYMLPMGRKTGQGSASPRMRAQAELIDNWILPI